MPKIFALRDRLQAVQEYLNDNEEDLQIFPVKQPFVNNHVTFPPLPLETVTSCSLQDDQGQVLGKDLIGNSSRNYDGGFSNTDDDLKESQIITEISEPSNPQLEENSCVPENQYMINSAIETSHNENNLPEISQKQSPNAINGKLYSHHHKM